MPKDNLFRKWNVTGSLVYHNQPVLASTGQGTGESHHPLS